MDPFREDIAYDMHHDGLHLDGNVLAGPMREIFGRELTTCVARCRTCGASNEMGALVDYNCAPGHVLRCPDCAGILLVMVHTRGSYRLTFEGLESLELPNL